MNNRTNESAMRAAMARNMIDEERRRTAQTFLTPLRKRGPVRNNEYRRDRITPMSLRGGRQEIRTQTRAKEKIGKKSLTKYTKAKTDAVRQRDKKEDVRAARI